MDYGIKTEIAAERARIAAGEPTPDLVLATYDSRGFTYATETALAFLLAQE